jgi:cation:H+ antiporter
MMEFTSVEAFILAIGCLGLGMIMLIRGGDWAIDGAVYVARHFGISPLIVGFTIVAFGTSFPELLVSLTAHLNGSSGIAVGNVLGSNVANVLLVIGATAVIATVHVVPRALMRDLTMMMFSTAVLLILFLYGGISQGAAMGMVGILIAYVFWQYSMAGKGEIPMEEVEEPEFERLRTAMIYLFLGFAAIALGAEFLVRGAKVSATVIGVPDAVIGLSVIAIGTSLPELSTCIIAARRGQSDLVVGNIIGSNVFNILMILGVTGSIKPYFTADIVPQLVNFDMWVMAGVSGLFTVMLLFYKKITKPLGYVFLAGYIAYMLATYLYGFSELHKGI